MNIFELSVPFYSSNNSVLHKILLTKYPLVLNNFNNYIIRCLCGCCVNAKSRYFGDSSLIILGLL
jgi:hypothetical protein